MSEQDDFKKNTESLDYRGDGWTNIKCKEELLIEAVEFLTTAEQELWNMVHNKVLSSQEIGLPVCKVRSAHTSIILLRNLLIKDSKLFYSESKEKEVFKKVKQACDMHTKNIIYMNGGKGYEDSGKMANKDE